MNAPSSRILSEIARNGFFPSFLIFGKAFAPSRMTSSTKASRVPDVGGGPRTSIFTFGRLGSISLHILYGLSTILSPEGTFAARAKKICFFVSFKSAPAFDCPIAIPSYPIFTSTTSFTPFAAHFSTSDFLIRREAFVMSGWLTPTPAQNNLIPPPEPVDSTTGALKELVFPKVSATAVEKGKTVEEPTIRI